jgi:hypothetical protein
MGMELLLKIIHKGPLILCLEHLEGHLAIGTHNEITWFLITIQRDLCFTDGAYQFVCHGFFPQFLIRISILEIAKKIKRILFPFLKGFLIMKQKIGPHSSPRGEGKGGEEKLKMMRNGI